MSGQDRIDLKETLSALMDGEATDWETRRVLDEITRDAELRNAWQQYQTNSALLRKGVGKGTDISLRVMQALENQPAHRQIPQFFKPLGQVAIAASVAAIALVTVQQVQMPGVEGAGLTAAYTAADDNLDTNRYQPVVVPEGFDLPPMVSQPVSSSSNRPLELVTLHFDGGLFDKAGLDLHLHESVQLHLENSAELDGNLLPFVRDLGDAVPLEQ